MRVFEHENSWAISLVERRFSRYFSLSTFAGMKAELMYMLDFIENWGLSTDSVSR